MTLLYIALGGALGALTRYGVGGWVQERAGFAFPMGTLTVNVLGSLLIGFSLRYLEAIRLAPEVRVLVAVGFLGAFTTFSTYSYETITLLEEGALGRAATYALGSLALGLGAAYVGVTLSAYVLRVRG
jgi:CrcB protein